MTFGKRIRELRLAKGLTLRDLSAKVGVGFTYLSKIENHKLSDGHFPSEKLIHKLADELLCNEDELLLLADRVPRNIRKRIRERPEAFQQFAKLSNKEMDRLIAQMSDRG